MSAFRQPLLPMCRTRADEIEDAARKAWRDHPEFVAEIARLAREERRFVTGYVSIGDLFVVAARNLRMNGVTVRPNHNWRRPWASWLMHDYPDLDGAFRLRDTDTDTKPAKEAA